MILQFHFAFDGGNETMRWACFWEKFHHMRQTHTHFNVYNHNNINSTKSSTNVKCDRQKKAVPSLVTPCSTAV